VAACSTNWSTLLITTPPKRVSVAAALLVSPRDGGGGAGGRPLTGAFRFTVSSSSKVYITTF